MNSSGLRPVEFFVVVELDPTERTTAGGIIIPETTQERDKLAAQQGTLVAVSPHAFTYADGWPEGSIPQVGQRVLFKKYEGSNFKRKVGGTEREFKLLNDKSIIAVIEDAAPAAIAA